MIIIIRCAGVLSSKSITKTQMKKKNGKISTRRIQNFMNAKCSAADDKRALHSKNAQSKQTKDNKS